VRGSPSGISLFLGRSLRILPNTQHRVGAYLRFNGAGPQEWCTIVKWKAGENTHENLVCVCSGGLSNTGLTTTLACIGAVKQLGLEKVGIGCLAALPSEVGPVLRKTIAAKTIVTVDGCPMRCPRKIVENAGFNIARGIVLTEDIGMKKKALHEDIGGDLKPLTDYISPEDVAKVKQLIVEAIEND